jgi:hypothetical protein
LTNISNFQITSNRKAAYLRLSALGVLISSLTTTSHLPSNLWQFGFPSNPQSNTRWQLPNQATNEKSSIGHRAGTCDNYLWTFLQLTYIKYYYKKTCYRMWMALSLFKWRVWNRSATKHCLLERHLKGLGIPYMMA